jgi:biopolymer transport protein ExbB
MFKITRWPSLFFALAVALAPIASAVAPAYAADPPAADAASPVAPAPAPVAATTTAAVENPYGLDALWKGGDFVARGTLIALVIMSVGTWYIMITKVWEQSRLLMAAKAANKSFWSAGAVTEGIKTLPDSSPFRFLAETGVKSTEHHEGELLEQIDLHTWVTMSIQRAVDDIQSRLQGGLAFLGTVGSTAPFVGLFGTVWGIYHALTAIGIAGQASIDKVAGPVGEALIMTAFGLFVAIPAVLGYNALTRANKALVAKLSRFAHGLHAFFVTGARLSSSRRDGLRLATRANAN